MGYFVEKLLKAFAIPIAVGVTCAPAQSRSLQVLGTAGYLSEWELNGTVMEKGPAGSNEFSGAVIWKHVGLCSVNGRKKNPARSGFRSPNRARPPRSMRRSPSTALNAPTTGNFPAARAGIWTARMPKVCRFRFRSSNDRPSAPQSVIAASYRSGPSRVSGIFSRITILRISIRRTAINTSCTHPNDVAASSMEAQSIWRPNHLLETASAIRPMPTAAATM